MEYVMMFLTSVMNMTTAGINLAIVIISRRRNKKDPRSAKRKS